MWLTDVTTGPKMIDCVPTPSPCLSDAIDKSRTHSIYYIDCTLTSIYIHFDSVCVVPGGGWVGVYVTTPSLRLTSPLTPDNNSNNNTYIERDNDEMRFPKLCSKWRLYSSTTKNKKKNIIKYQEPLCHSLCYQCLVCFVLFDRLLS